MNHSIIEIIFMLGFDHIINYRIKKWTRKDITSEGTKTWGFTSVIYDSHFRSQETFRERDSVTIIRGETRSRGKRVSERRKLSLRFE